MALTDVKALTFDMFGTVVNWRDSVAREAKAILGPKGYDKDWHDFADRWRPRCWHRSMKLLEVLLGSEAGKGK